MEGKISLPTASQNNHPLSDDAEHSNHSICCSQRLIVVLMGFLGGVMLETNRSNLSVAIVCMVNDTTGNYINGTKTTQTQSENAEFYWSKGEQSGILSAYFYGYMVTQLPSGILAAKYGGKYVMFMGMLIGSTASLLLPIGARTSIYLVYALRVILGLGMGVYNPTMQAIIGRWAPPLERTILTAICYSGFSFGIIATFTISGYMCIYGFDHGWGSIFYVPGAISMLWCCLWYITIASTPAQHPRISKRERNYIIQGIGETSQPYKTPWAAILTSPAFRAFVVGHVCFAWLVYTLTTNTPTFFKEVLNFDIAENGLLSAVPSTSQTVLGLLAGQVSDYLRSRKYLSTTATRRIFQSTAFLGAGACLVGTGFMDAERRYFAVFLLAAAMAFMGLATAGVLVNTADFAPRYAGILFGISNTVATTPGMLAPLLAGILTPNKTQEEWRNVFYVCGGVCILGTLVFGTQARGELQPWAVEQATVEVGEGRDVPGGLTNDAVVNGRLEKNTTFMSTHL